jgi:hypothetical protein
MQGNTANSQAELALDTRAFVACLGTTTVGVTAQSAEPRREAVVSLQEQLIPTIAGRNLVAVVVDYQPDGTSPPHRHPGADLIYAHVLSGGLSAASSAKSRQMSIEPGRTGSRCPARTARSARMPARPSLRECSSSLSSMGAIAL